MVGRSIAAFALNFIVSSRWARDKREEGKNIRGNQREREKHIGIGFGTRFDYLFPILSKRFDGLILFNGRAIAIWFRMNPPPAPPSIGLGFAFVSGKLVSFILACPSPSCTRISIFFFLDSLLFPFINANSYVYIYNSSLGYLFQRPFQWKFNQDSIGISFWKIFLFLLFLFFQEWIKRSLFSRNDKKTIISNDEI